MADLNKGRRVARTQTSLQRPLRVAPRFAARHGLRQAQQGVALAISLVLLVAMSVIGITTLAGTRLNEKVTSNAQQKAIAFEVAESAINTVWNVDEMIASIDQIPDADYDAPGPYEPPGIGVELSQDFDQVRDTSTTVNISGEVSIRVCGESIILLPTGTEVTADSSSTTAFASVLFDVNGVATIANSAARADHLQRGAIDRPATGRSGACVVPGI